MYNKYAIITQSVTILIHGRVIRTKERIQRHPNKMFSCLDPYLSGFFVSAIYMGIENCSKKL